MDYAYEVALSFAGEDRAFAEAEDEIRDVHQIINCQ